jgi:parallel beta-helix repeat protein
MNYVPDAIYGDCVNDTNACTVCSNVVYSNELGVYVHDSQRGKVFCPFGVGESMNKSIFMDQINVNNPRLSKWGMAPQLDPRPLTKVGLYWRTS